MDYYQQSVNGTVETSLAKLLYSNKNANNNQNRDMDSFNLPVTVSQSLTNSSLDSYSNIWFDQMTGYALQSYTRRSHVLAPSLIHSLYLDPSVTY